MRIIVQRVLSASVKVHGELQGSISAGYLLYVCIEKGDTEKTIENAAKKILDLRVNEDDQKKMNLNISQTNGELLSISQFTLSWDGQKGNRPSFEKSMPPVKAQELYNLWNLKLRESDLKVQEGIFGADMKVESINDGPVTFIFNF